MGPSLTLTLAEAEQVYSRIGASHKSPEHAPSYLSIDGGREENARPVFFFYQEGDHVYYHPFLLSPIQDTLFNEVQSAYGYGGPVCTTDDGRFIKNALKSYRSWCEEQRVLVEFIRFHPLLANQRFYEGETALNRQTVALSLDEEASLFLSYQARVRTTIRKANSHGLRLEIAESYTESGSRLFSEMYTSTMASLNADVFYFFNERYMKRLLKDEHTLLITCYREDEAVAAAIFIAREGKMEYHLSASTESGKKLNAVSMIIHQAAIFGYKNGYDTLHLGGGTDDSPANPLLFFKRGFSKRLLDFYIGYRIYNSDAYRALKDRYAKERGTLNNRVLFYRF